MPTLRSDDIEVRLPQFAHRTYKARSCHLLLPISPSNRDAMLDLFRKVGPFGPYDGLWISGIADLSFLAEFPDLLYLHIDDGPRINIQHLNPLRNLRGLRLDAPAAGIDFSWFPELELFVGDWHADHSNFVRCRELRTLYISQFKPRSGTFAELSRLTRLETLQLIRTSIASLDGIETLEDLRYLEIAYAPKLVSLDAFSTGTSDIRELTLKNARKIASYLPLVSITHLRRLKLTSSAPMPDLRWIHGMNRLDQLSLVETNVVDGNLAPLLDLPALRYAGFMDHKHYSHKFQQLNDLLALRAAPTS